MRSSWIRMETWCCGWGATPSIRVPAWTTTSFAEAVPAESATAATAANSANFIEISPSSFASFRSEALHAILHPIGGRIVTPFSPSPPINAPCAILNATVSGPVALRNLIAAVERIDPLTVSGRVAAVNGLLIEARGGLTRLAVGARAEIERRAAQPLPAEVVGFRAARALLLPFGPVEGVSPGAELRLLSDAAGVRPAMGWLGRVVGAFG